MITFQFHLLGVQASQYKVYTIDTTLMPSIMMQLTYAAYTKKKFSKPFSHCK